METITVAVSFTKDQWDLIYNFVGNALDDDDYNPEDVYTIRNKIHQLHTK
jgi:hypothetical protein